MFEILLLEEECQTTIQAFKYKYLCAATVQNNFNVADNQRFSRILQDILLL